MSLKKANRWAMCKENGVAKDFDLSAYTSLMTLVLGLFPAVTPHVHGSECTEHVDEIPDCVCDVCGESLPHTYDGENYYQDTSYHYAMCDVCGHLDGLNCNLHEDSDSDCICDVCEYSMHQIDQLEDQGDGNHQGTCTLCEQTVTLPHVYDDCEWDTEGHWHTCDDCGQITSSPDSHSFDYQYYYEESDKHYPECDGCDYYKEAHVDEDNDEECDICDGLIHEHTYEYEYWVHDDGKHYLVCDLCDKYDSSKGEACTDTDNDHRCDVCHTHLDDLCYATNNDTDGNHICDVCDVPMNDLCGDTNGNHICDAEGCQRHMKELCSASAEGDWLCDTCCIATVVTRKSGRPTRPRTGSVKFVKCR